MNLVEFAETYVSDRNLAKTPVYSARRFEKLMGSIDVSEVSRKDIEKFVAKCQEEKLSAWTVAGGVKDLRTLIIAATGNDPGIVSVKTPDPNPQAVPIETIDCCWPHMEPWCRQWVVLSYWTGLRLGDSVRLQVAKIPSDQIVWIANKTGRIHRVPVPVWMRKHCDPVDLPYGKNQDHNSRVVRNGIESACRKADVPVFLPCHLRDRSLTEWMKADGTVGKMMHGCGLGVLDHYVCKSDLILHAGERLVMPASFGASTDTSESMMKTFKRLDAAGQKLIAETASRMVRVG